MKIIVSLIILLICLELFLYLIIPNLKKKFQWILFPEDLYPNFDEIKFQNYLKKSYDKNLGWVRKSNIKGHDKIDQKKIEFNIDAKGYRKLKSKNKKTKITSFGGSFVFGRQVKDFETWQEFISKDKNYNLTNYGVGNYGTDQAILRYKYTKFNKSVDTVLLGIVPEHISRIQSEWKHFFEFGNIHGFKPKFYLRNEKLLLKKNPLKKNTKFKNLNKIIESCIKTDRFYDEKFKKNIFRFPYLFTFFRNLKFISKILFIFVIHNKDPNIKDLFLKEVMKRNIISSHNLYGEKYSRQLFLKLIKYYKKIAKEKNHKPFLIIFPQKIDIIEDKTNKIYINYFRKIISKELSVLDLTVHFNKQKCKKYFVNSIYGGHLNSKGNRFVANKIKNFLEKNNVV